MATDPQEWTVLSILEWGTDYFKKKKVPDPRLSIEWLLADILAVKRLDLYLQFNRPLASAELQNLRPLIKRRARHEPLQYITGSTDFMNAHIRLNPSVLIPRIETEQLVEMVLDHHPADSVLSMLDIGTGSGCIAIAAKMERPSWQVQALDISSEALELAQQNATVNNTDIHTLQGDILHWEQLPLAGTFDLIISNPPYILTEEKELLEPQVTAYEPALALFCNNITKMYQSIIDFAVKYLAPNGMLYLEIHEQYSPQLFALFDAPKWEASLLQDYAKKPRFIIAKRTI